MEIAILCAVALIATCASWIYLSNRKPVAEIEEGQDNCEVQTETDEPVLDQTPVEETAETTEGSEKGSLLKMPVGKQWIYIALMLIGLCGMAVVLEKVYTNTLLQNLKLITLLAILFTAANVDAKEKRIPNVLILTGLVLRVAFWIAELICAPDRFLSVVKNDLLACLLVVAFFVIGVLLVKGGLGMGDIKLMLIMCLFQGFYGVVSALFFSLFMSFLYVILVLIAKKKTRKDSVAFAPAILLGTMLSVFLTGM